MTAKLTAPAQSDNWGQGFSVAGEHKVVWGILNPLDIAKDRHKKYDKKDLQAANKEKNKKEKENKQGKNPWKYMY